MKAITKIFIICIVFQLSACSLFQRKQDNDSLDPPFPPSEIENPGEEFSENKPPLETSKNTDSLIESEITRLNSKIEALETKIAVLSESNQNKKDLKEQPELHAEPSGSMASAEAPTEELAPVNGGTVEKNFQQAMQELKSKNYRESANNFFSIAKNNRTHTLAPHALYWAGVASAQAKNWKIAIKHWSNLENNYPRSFYISEALAGLSTAYKMTMDQTMAKHYEDILVKAFPDSPATLSLSMKNNSEPADIKNSAQVEDEIE